MIESFNGLYKWEFIYPHGPWHGQSNVEFATLEYVDWFNHRRRHGSIPQATAPTPHPQTTKPFTTVKQTQPPRP